MANSLEADDIDAATDRLAGVIEYLDSTHRDIDLQLIRLDLLTARLMHRTLRPEEMRLGEELVRFFRQQARAHHADEEEHVIPLLLKASDPGAGAMARGLLEDHRCLEEIWQTIDTGLSAALAGSAWLDVQELSSATEIFSNIYAAHMATEESLAYPMAHAEWKHA